MRNALALTTLALILPGGIGHAAPLTLVQDAGTTFVIYVAADAPPSVRQAAAELQDYACQVAGAKLTIVNDPHDPMICLGDNAATRAAGITVADIPLEGFQILARGGSIYIAGPDTGPGERTPNGGTSAGTRNGAYAFIEQFLGVRWLDPSGHGDYVPRTTTITVPDDTDITDAPFFLNRRVPYTQQERPEVMKWWDRQRLGHSLFLTHGHNWERPIPTSLFDEHPDWFAERGGIRIPPAGRYKLCVTNPGMIRAFADAAIAHFDANPASMCFSLSPSDSAGWCECAGCTALYETDPNGDLSVTPAIINFYNEVGKLVIEKHPDKLLAAYVYAAYVFPPSTPIALQPNVFLVWAPSFDYGYTLVRPELQQQWDALLKQWIQVTENISYYDLPFNLSTEAGALNPPGLKIMKFIYPRLKQANLKGVYVYGIEAWGRGGPLNYLLAKVAWDPDADVDALFVEYCQKAYAEGAPEMEHLWRLMDAEIERHYLEFPDARWTLTMDMMSDIYAKNLPEIERLYRAAEAKITDPDAKARLRMIGDNLTVLHWNLRHYKLVDQNVAPSFHLSDPDFFEFLTKTRGSLALAPERATGRDSRVAAKLVLAPVTDVPNSSEVKPFLLRGDQHLVIYPLGKGKVTITLDRITARGKMLKHSVYGANGEDVTAGMVSSEIPIELDGEGSAYYHLMITAGSATFRATVSGAAWAVDESVGEQGLHLLGKMTPLYFEVPAGVDVFHLSLGAGPPGETAIATLFAPDGTDVARYDCTEVPVDRKQIPSGGKAGWWKLLIEAAPAGSVDDVYVDLGEEVPGFLSIDPKAALSVRVAK